MLQVSETEPFFGLSGPDPGSELRLTKKRPLTTSPFGSDLLAQVKVSPEVVWGVLEPSFHSLRDNEIN